jgi:hypothetical protein
LTVLGPETDSRDVPSATIDNVALQAGPSHEEYFLALAMTSLLAILKDSTLSAQYAPALDAVMTITRSLRRRCAPYWPQAR